MADWGAIVGAGGAVFAGWALFKSAESNRIARAASKAAVDSNAKADLANQIARDANQLSEQSIALAREANDIVERGVTAQVEGHEIAKHERVRANRAYLELVSENAHRVVGLSSFEGGARGMIVGRLRNTGRAEAEDVIVTATLLDDSHASSHPVHVGGGMTFSFNIPVTRSSFAEPFDAPMSFRVTWTDGMGPQANEILVHWRGSWEQPLMTLELE